MQEVLNTPYFKTLPRDLKLNNSSTYPNHAVISMIEALRDFLYEKYGEFFIENANIHYTLNSTIGGEKKVGETTMPHSDFSADTLANCYNNYRML